MTDLHPFLPPDPNVHVWRYTHLHKLLWPLETRSLYLTLLDELRRKFDRFEASVPASVHDDQLPILSSNNQFRCWDEIAAEYPVEPREDGWARIARLRRGLLRTAHASCWRWGEESEAMWRLYCENGEGIAIRSTFASLQASVADPHTCVSLVRYLNYRTGRFERHGHDWDPALHKREAFKHEQEVRVLRHDPSDWHRAAADMTETFTLPTGVAISWNPVDVIEAVVVNPLAPDGYFDEVRDEIGRREPALRDRVMQSEIATEPIRY